jgi:hypothetical protein
MPTWSIVVLVVLGALLLLALDDVNRALAAARATDRGWEPGTMEAAARAAFARGRPGVEVRELTLVQVIDRPGTEEDKAVFQVAYAQAQVLVTLGRTGGEWVGESVQDA